MAHDICVEILTLGQVRQLYARRLAFRLRNGLLETGVSATVYGVDYAILPPRVVL